PGPVPPADPAPAPAPLAEPAGRATAQAQDPAAPAATTGRARRQAGAGDQGLTRERIIATAIALADAEGLETLSMRRVAADLGVATMALYRHLPGKEELLDLMADSVIGSRPLPQVAEPGWRPRLAAIARLEWALYRDHPWLAGTMSLTRPTPLPNALRHGEWVLSSLEELRLDPATRLYTHILLFAFVRGLAVNLGIQAHDRRHSELSDEEWMAGQESAFLSLLSTGDYPSFGRLMGELDAARLEMEGADSFEFDLDLLFEYALTRLLDGLGLLFEPPTRAAPTGTDPAAAG
ncbi:TetR/AcrR family transcriptional regulator, partial [Kitasatospora nipponensis]|uniref:TetR/AcrR family transcriptional regulator n=1 Tax=Kitasatospora nipponensis TaxID=258049 RepID=UPI0031E3A7D0